MIAHVLGWTTVTTTGLGAAVLLRVLWHTATRPWSWQRPVPLPKLVKHQPTDTPDSYVGLV